MSKNTRQQWKDKNQGELDAGGAVDFHPPLIGERPTEEPAAALPPLAKDGAIASNPGALGPPKPDANCIARGQVYDDVEVPNRPINKLGLRPGALLKPLEVESPYGDGRWMACFVGERMTKIDVDAEMLKTGKLRV